MRCEVDLSNCARMMKLCKAAAFETNSENVWTTQPQMLTQILDLKKSTTEATQQINREVDNCKNSLAELRISFARSQGDGAESRLRPHCNLESAEKDQENREQQRKAPRLSDSFKIYDFNVTPKEKNKGMTFKAREINISMEKADKESQNMRRRASREQSLEQDFLVRIPEGILSAAKSNTGAVGKNQSPKTSGKTQSPKASEILKEKNPNSEARSPKPRKAVTYKVNPCRRPSREAPSVKPKKAAFDRSLIKTRMKTGTIAWVKSPNHPTTRKTVLVNGERAHDKPVKSKVRFDDEIQYKEISPRSEK